MKTKIIEDCNNKIYRFNRFLDDIYNYSLSLNTLRLNTKRGQDKCQSTSYQ